MADFELTDFQKKKLLRVFTTFFDINNDGVIEWEDFDIALEKIRALHNWAHGCEQHRNAVDALRLVWDGLKSYADKNEDNKITQDEWCRMWTECINAHNNNKSLPEWHHRYVQFMFDVNDASGDDNIDKQEYTTVYTSYGLSAAECEKAFDKFASSGQVGREEFSRLFTEYFVSTDPNAKGSFLFGVIDQ